MSDAALLPRPGDSEYNLLWKIVSVLAGGFVPPTPPIPPSDVDPDAEAWATVKVPANGGTVSESTLTAVSDFCIAVKAAGIWDSILRINLYAGDQLAACLTPLKDLIGTPGIDVNSGSVTFMEGDYSEVTGLTGTFVVVPVEKYLDTGVLPPIDLALNDYHLALYERTDEVPPGAAFECGVWNGTDSNATYILPDYLNGGTSYFAAWDDNVNVSAADVDPKGFYTGTRIIGGTTLYKNGGQIGTAVNSGALPDTGSFLVHCVRFFSAPNYGTGRTLAGYSLGLSMDSIQASAYYAAWQTFQTALGRNV